MKNKNSKMKNIKSNIKSRVILLSAAVFVIIGVLLVINVFGLAQGDVLNKTIKEITVPAGAVDIKIIGTGNGIELKTYKDGKTDTENFPRGNYIFKTEYAAVIIYENLKFNITNVNREVYEKHGIRVGGVTDFLGNAKTLEIEIQNPGTDLYNEILKNDEKFKEIIESNLNDGEKIKETDDDKNNNYNDKFKEISENRNKWNIIASFGSGGTCSYKHEWFVVDNKTLYVANVDEEENKINSIYEVSDVSGMTKDAVLEIAEKMEDPNSHSIKEVKEKINQTLENDDEFKKLTGGKGWTYDGIIGGPVPHVGILVNGEKSYIATLDLILETVIDIKDVSRETKEKWENEKEENRKKFIPPEPLSSEEVINEQENREDKNEKATNEVLPIALADDRVKEIINGKRYNVTGHGSSMILGYEFKSIELGIGGAGRKFDAKYEIVVDMAEGKVLSIKNTKEILSYIGRERFNLDINYEQYLKNGSVVDELRKTFEDNDIYLSENAVISQTHNSSWKIDDGAEKHSISNIDNELFVSPNVCRDIFAAGEFKKLAGNALNDNVKITETRVNRVDNYDSSTAKELAKSKLTSSNEFKEISKDNEWKIIMTNTRKTVNSSGSYSIVHIWFVVDNRTLYMADVDLEVNEVKSIKKIRDVSGMSKEDIWEIAEKIEKPDEPSDKEIDEKIIQIIENDDGFKKLVDGKEWEYTGRAGATDLITRDVVVDNRSYVIAIDMIGENVLTIKDVTEAKKEWNKNYGNKTIIPPIALTQEEKIKEWERLMKENNEGMNETLQIAISDTRTKEILEGKRYVINGGGGSGGPGHAFRAIKIGVGSTAGIFSKEYIIYTDFDEKKVLGVTEVPTVNIIDEEALQIVISDTKVKEILGGKEYEITCFGNINRDGNFKAFCINVEDGTETISDYIVVIDAISEKVISVKEIEYVGLVWTWGDGEWGSGKKEYNKKLQIALEDERVKEIIDGENYEVTCSSQGLDFKSFRFNVGSKAYVILTDLDENKVLAVSELDARNLARC